MIPLENTGDFMQTSNTCITYGGHSIYTYGDMFMVQDVTDGNWMMFHNSIYDKVCNGTYDEDQAIINQYNFSAIVTC